MNPVRRPVRSLPAANVHAWRIRRQMLASGFTASDPVDVARTLVGVQAQVASAAVLAIALRSGAARGATTSPTLTPTATALRDRRLVRSWAMRGTLHLFAAEDVPTIAAALGGRDNWRRPAWLRWFGVTEAEMDALIDSIGDILDDGRPRTRAELADEIGMRLGARAGALLLGSWGSALKVASDRHYLCQSVEDDAGVRFVKAARWIEGWREEDPEAALAVLVERYLAAYGPATLKEILRWWGVSRVSVMQPMIASFGERVTEVDVDGTRAYVRSQDVDDIAATRPPADDVRLVGPFDPLIVGAGLREQLLPAAHIKRVSRTAGWISPVVLVDGRAGGVWHSARDGDRLRITIDAFEPLDHARRVAIERAAERVAAAQGTTATVSYGPVFAAGSKSQRLAPGTRNA